MSELRVRCLKCDGTDIRERNTAYAELSVLAWRRDGDGVMPDDYDTGVSADWEVEDVSHQYVCGDCGHEMRIDELVGEEVPE